MSNEPAMLGFQKRTLTHSFSKMIRKVKLLYYEFTDLTLTWEDDQWVAVHKVILAGCSPKKNPNPHFLAEWYYPETRAEMERRFSFLLRKIPVLDETIVEMYPICDMNMFSNITTCDENLP